VPGASAVAVAGDLVYVAEPDAVAVVDTVLSRDATTTMRFAPDGVPDELVASGSRMWGVSSATGAVWPIEDALVRGVPAQTGEKVAAAAPGAEGALWLAVDGGATRIALLRPGSVELAPVAPGARHLGATALTETDAGLWIVDAPSSTLTLLEAR
jgi:hypothetical protein